MFFNFFFYLRLLASLWMERVVKAPFIFHLLIERLTFATQLLIGFFKF